MKEFICIECPKGCYLKVDDDLKVSGNSCPRGSKYAINEVTNPKRILTSTVKITDGIICRLPVITSVEIPKNIMFEVMEEINKVTVVAPVKLHQIIIKNVCGLEADIVATRTVNKK